MPVIVRVKCQKCKGETDPYNENCFTCEVKEYFKIRDGAKYLPSHYTSNQEKRGNERAANERNFNINRM